MRRLHLLLAALAALPLSLHAVPAAAQTAAAAASAAAIGAITTTTPVSQKPRAIQQFTTGWRFLQADAAGAEKPGFDDSAWKSVTLPHDWSIAGPVKEDAPSRGAGGFAPTGIGWYRKSFTVPAADAKPSAARRTFVVFDGVMANSDVYLNGELLGHRPYGYVSFTYELTPHLQAGKNVIAVKVDDSQQPASRWYPGAGINRQVRLITTGDAHIVPWGTFVTTPAVSAESATIHVRSTVTNESATDAKLSLRVRLTGPGGSAVLAGKTINSARCPGPTAGTSTTRRCTPFTQRCCAMAKLSMRRTYRSAFASSTSMPTKASF
jgi:beta-galactosidase